MLKRPSVAFAALFALATAAHAAGTVPGFSLTPQFDLTGKVMPGCRAYIIQAGTTSTPQQPYQDSGLTILAPNPLICDAAGRISQFFVADGVIKIRVTTSAGVQTFIGDNLLVVGASSGGGGGGSVDPTTIIATGDVKVKYGTGVLSGFVRLNGRTIGSATSGATERANSDVQALFEYLWGADANLAVSGGRGASANADYVANKTLTLPDGRSRALTGLDDMGNSAASRITATTCSAPTTLGTGCGTETKTIAQGNLPNVSLSTSIASGQGSHSHTVDKSQSGDLVGFRNNIPGGGSAIMLGLNTGIDLPLVAATTTLPAMTGTTPLGGSGTALSSLMPILMITYYIKL